MIKKKLKIRYGGLGFRSSVALAVDALTRREAYEAYLKKVQATGHLAMQVEVCDLTDNIDRPMP